MFYLICYDIVKDNRRNKVAKLLEGYGVRVQKSVFEAVLSDSQYDKLHQKLAEMINAREDQIRFYPMSAPSRKKTIVLGSQPDWAIDDPLLVF